MVLTPQRKRARPVKLVTDPVTGLAALSAAQVRTLLLRLKQARRCPLTFLPDEHDVTHLPGWVKAPNQTTDGHLAELANAHGATLATFDESIAGSYVIPR
jgi:hypothetical protein